MDPSVRRSLPQRTSWKPEDESKVSIRTSPWTQLLLQLSNVQLHRVCQWRWGASAVKPTGILAINCLHFAQSVYHRELPNAVNPDYAATGRYPQTGAFGTSVLKEYHPPFSAALAGAVADCLVSATHRGQTATGSMVEPDTEACLQAARAACIVIRRSIMASRLPGLDFCTLKNIRSHGRTMQGSKDEPFAHGK